MEIVVKLNLLIALVICIVWINCQLLHNIEMSQHMMLYFDLKVNSLEKISVDTSHTGSIELLQDILGFCA